ncbi:hypothetical protein [Chitinivorax sp. B]|uniref:hypothetical protein n=1 Tax=Chitinivorax sp. B TaxID=2502235 RepID=UPI0010F6474A|nr:hypothetical protein [Chitinivorax sp. B]
MSTFTLRTASGLLAITTLFAGAPAIADQQPATTTAMLGAAPLLAPIAVTKTYSAAVDAAGTLIFGPAGASSNLLLAGSYQVIFPSDVSKCVYTAILGSTAPASPAPGIIVVSPRAGNVNGVFIKTTNLAGVLLNQAFHLHVQC